MPEAPTPKATAAQPVAHDLDRDRLVPVGDQRDLRDERMHARDLADHAGIVGHRAAGAHAVLRRGP